MTEPRQANEELLDDLALLAEGDAASRTKHAAALAGDANARDLVYESEALVASIRDAGADHRLAEDLEARVMARLGARSGSLSDALSGANNAPAFGAQFEANREPSAAPVPRAFDEPRLERTQRASQPYSPTPRARIGASEEPKPTRLAMIAFFAAAGFAGIASIGGLAWWATRTSAPAGQLASTAPRWNGRIEAAFPDPNGLSVGNSGTFAARSIGQDVTAGQAIRTDERTRARIRMADGTQLFLEQSTELVVEAGGRMARVVHGVVVADVAHLDNAPGVVFSTPDGRVEVLGTKLSITASAGGSSVRVLRGRVRIANDSGAAVELDAGEEGLLSRGRAPSKSVATTFSEFDDPELDDEAEAESVPGLGELRARRPGERQEQERPLTLAEHRVDVRIVGPVARTEVEESFRNDDDATLEGVYRFPVPDGARIASLSLEVEGRWEQGAFVTKDRARSIFQGVIEHATPHPDVPRPQQEWIWVPGPWRDPALLEWQRGGRFELRIFPIAGHSVRKVRLAYEQTLPVTSTGRRYVYPLPSVRRGEARVGQFAFDVRVSGATDVATSGYTLTEARDGESRTLSFASAAFAPSGAIAIDYQLPNAGAELRSYSYRGPAAVAPGAHAREDEPVRVAQTALAADGRAYVSLAFRPEIPNGSRFRATDYALVLDSSQSMTGERFARSRAVATAFVRELDRRHRVRVLVCDLGCRAIEDALAMPGPELAARVDGQLASVRPMGSSNLLAAIDRASTGFGSDTNRPRAVIYLGDGMGSVGVTDLGSLEQEVRTLASRRGVSIDTVGIGDDADGRALAAIARAGAGHHVPYLPGQRASSAALAMLEATFGSSIEHPVLTLPAGVEAVAPAELGTVRPGEEFIVNARYTGSIRGEAILRGKVAGQSFERRFPIVLDAEPSAVNGFVPRAWATSRIEDLDASNEPAKRAESIALSKAFGVLSRDTSLLVLESEAMVRAYGIDRTENHVQFSGDSLDEDVADAVGDDRPMDSLASAQGVGTRGGRIMDNPYGGGGEDFARAPAPAAAPRPTSEAAEEAPMRRDTSNRATGTTTMTAPPVVAQPTRPRGPGQWMRVVWVREARIDASPSGSDRDADAVATARVAHDASPDSRDKTRDFARALSRAGRLDEALATTEAWLARDPNDVEALVLESDLVGRLGRSEDSARILSGVVDAEPNDANLHERLALAFERAGRFEDACAHRLVLGSLRSQDAAATTQASACATRLGLTHVGDAIRSASEGLARRADARIVSGDAENVRGEISVDASSSGGAVEVSIITPKGERASWLGGPRGTTARPANGSSSTSVAIRTARGGSYYVEVSRANGVTGVVRGELRIRALGQSRTIPFVLDESHESVARIAVTRRRTSVAW